MQWGHHSYQTQSLIVRRVNRSQEQETQESWRQEQDQKRRIIKEKWRWIKQHINQVQVGHPKTQEHFCLHQRLPINSRRIQEADAK